MDSCSDQVECNGHLRIELEDAIKLVGPGDLVRSHTPGKAADAAQMLCFPKERFTALQRRFTRCPLDGDAGNVCDLCNAIVFRVRVRVVELPIPATEDRSRGLSQSPAA